MFYFKDNAELDNLDGVPTEYKSMYAAGQDGKFRVIDAMKVLATNIDGLRGNLTTAQESVTRANGESAQRRVALEAFTALGIGATPEEAKAKIDQMTKDLTDGKKINPDTIRAEVAAQYETKLADAVKANGSLETELTEVLIGDHVTRAIVEHKGNPALLTAVARSKIGIIKDPTSGKRMAVGINEKGEALPGVDGGYMSVSKVIENLKANKDFAPAFEGTTQTGGGLRPQQQRQVVRGPVGGGVQQQQGDAPRSPMSKITAGLAARAAGGR